jgi:hypothetical protein
MTENGDPERDEQLRAEGRAQANNAITWNTSCIGCAGRLDSLYAERVAGGADMLGDVVDLLTAQGLDDAVAAVRAYAVRNSLQLRESASEGASEWDSEGAPV